MRTCITYILQGMASVRNLLVGASVLFLEANGARGRIGVHHLAGARFAALRPRLIDRVDGERAHCCCVGGVPNCVVHSGGAGNRTPVRKAPMYGISFRLNPSPPSCQVYPGASAPADGPVSPAPSVGWGRRGRGTVYRESGPK